MGHHYVPRRYLRGFQDPTTPDFIWTYDKKKPSPSRLPISKVAQSSGYYDQNVEDSLDRDVERPGGDVIDKIRDGKAITQDDRMHLTYHIATMMRRVPAARSQAEALLPGVLEEVKADTQEWLSASSEAGLFDEETLRKRSAEAEAVFRRLETETPPEVLERIRTPWPFARMLLAIRSMRWMLFRSEGPSYFLTGDNPVHYFRHKGIGPDNGELSFPLCHDLVLYCNWKNGPNSETPVPIAQRAVKEFNRRTASASARFLFYHESAPWVPQLQERPNLPVDLGALIS